MNHRNLRVILVRLVAQDVETVVVIMAILVGARTRMQIRAMCAQKLIAVIIRVDYTTDHILGLNVAKT
jgi:hypothetical protein